MTKYTFEMYHQITSQTTIEAKSYKEAELLLLAGDCEWEEVSSEGGDWELVSQSLPKSEINPTPFIERLKDAYYKKPIEFTSEPKVNAEGVPITYANKDELSAEDIESSRSGE
jgi:hypothetical protein